MQKILLVLMTLCAPILLRGQQTAVFPKIYTIFQQKCASCHASATRSGGLDLEGTGATLAEKQASVLANLVNATPTNTTANGKGYKRVWAGRADRSFLFHKINGDFDTYYTPLSTNEGSTMPRSGTALTKTEKEFIRQWILFGAKANVVIPEARIRAFYDTAGKAMNSFQTPPPAPTASEGFQVRVGPFFLGPQGQPDDELEYYQKWEVNLPQDVEVNRVNHIFANYSHHFIIYSYNSAATANTVADGLRTNPYHNNINLVSAVQEATDLKLPPKTAYKWPKNRFLDLNTHYINYSSQHVYKAEAYLNFYTQPNGTAKQEMKATLIANTNISIPNNNQTTLFEQPLVLGLSGKLWIWGVMGHTHKYGTGYKVYKRNADGTKGDIMYDAACPVGIPNCPSPWFDYQHIPIRFFQNFTPVDANPGIIHQATWKNNGPTPVRFGVTSDDEMMVLVALYVTDTTGLQVATSTQNIAKLEDVRIYPNPAKDQLTVDLPPSVSAATLTLFDILGRAVRRVKGTGRVNIQRGTLESGVYLVKIEDDKGRVSMNKVFWE
jgi:Secretion system C-terminal sorting domain